MIALLAAAAFATAPQPVPLEVLSVGIDRRVLTVAYESGPCWAGDPDALALTESENAVRLTLVQERVDGCSEPPTYRRLKVRLRHPLAGRRFDGHPRVVGAPAELRRRTAPRVIDFDPDGARRALAMQGFRARRLGRAGGTVAFQSPFPGRKANGRVVRLTLGRDLFHMRALDRCLERAGVPTRPRRPRPDDFDAPDLVLWLRSPDAMASVGFYRDSVRARELAPAVRRNIRRAGGVFERDGHVTIAWYAKPASDLRDRARTCVYGPLARPTT